MYLTSTQRRSGWDVKFIEGPVDFQVLDQVLATPLGDRGGTLVKGSRFFGGILRRSGVNTSLSVFPLFPRLLFGVVMCPPGGP